MPGRTGLPRRSKDVSWVFQFSSAASPSAKLRADSTLALRGVVSSSDCSSRGRLRAKASAGNNAKACGDTGSAFAGGVGGPRRSSSGHDAGTVDDETLGAGRLRLCNSSGPKRFCSSSSSESTKLMASRSSLDVMNELYILLQQQSLQVLQHCATAHNFEPKTQHATLHVLQHRQTDRQTDRHTSRHTDRHTLIYSRLFFPHRSDRCCIIREFNKCAGSI